MASASRETGPSGRPDTPNLKFEILAPGIPPRVLEMRQDIVRIGKLSSSHLQIQDAAVSRVHAVIEATAQGEFFVIDLGSSNGTFVNGQKIAKERLRSGDEMTFGQTRVRVTIEGGQPSPEEEPTKTVPPAAAPAAPAAAPTSSATSADLLAQALKAEAPKAEAPKAEAPKAEAPKAEAPKAEAPKAEAPKAEAPKAEPPKAEAPKAEPPKAEAPKAEPPKAASRPATAEVRRPTDRTGAERRFIAINPAEPLSKEPTDAAELIEVRLAFGRDIVEARTFEAGGGRGRGRFSERKAFRRTGAVTIGPSQANDFVIGDVDGVSGHSYVLLRGDKDGFSLRIARGMKGRVRLGEEDLDLEEIARRPETDRDGDVANWPFRRGALVSLRAGATTLYLRSVPVAPKPPVTFFDSTDPRLMLSLLGVTLFVGALVWRAVTWPQEATSLLDDRLKLDEKMVNMLINPEERLRKAKIYGAKIKDKNKGDDGKDKKADDGPKEKKQRPEVRKAEKVRELTEQEKKQRDIQKVRKLGALDALSKDATLKEILSGSSGAGAMGGIGGGAGSDASMDWAGAGPAGSDGSGLAGFTTGDGTTSGGGTGGRYVGVGKLRTRGASGGREGRRFGQGEAKIDDHKVAKPVVSVGEADVTGGLTKEIIRRVIRSHIHEVRYCYNRELQKNPSLFGKIVAKFTILPSGNVHQASIKSSTMQNENVELCILARVNRWTFPKPYKGSSVLVSYPFRFKAAGKD